MKKLLFCRPVAIEHMLLVPLGAVKDCLLGMSGGLRLQWVVDDAAGRYTIPPSLAASLNRGWCPCALWSSFFITITAHRQQGQVSHKGLKYKLRAIS